jgi:hypothetical protein
VYVPRETVVRKYSPYPHTSLVPFSKQKRAETSTFDFTLFQIFDIAMQDAITVPIEDRVLFYTFRALLAKVNGDDEQGITMLNNTKPIIMSNIEQVATDSTTALCCVYIAYYYMLESDTDRVSLFLALVKQFIKKNRNNKCNLIEILYYQLRQCIKKEFKVECTLKSFLVQYSMYVNYMVESKQIPLLEFVNDEDLEMMSTDLAMNKSDYKFDDQRLANIAEKIPIAFSAIVKKCPNTWITADNLVINMMIEELRKKEENTALLTSGLKNAVKTHLDTVSGIRETNYCTDASK